MIVEFGVVVLVVGVLGYVVHRYRKRAKWAKMRKGQLKRLKWLGDRIDSLWNEVHREELKRLKRLKEKGGE